MSNLGLSFGWFLLGPSVLGSTDTSLLAAVGVHAAAVLPEGHCSPLGTPHCFGFLLLPQTPSSFLVLQHGGQFPHHLLYRDFVYSVKEEPCALILLADVSFLEQRCKILPEILNNQSPATAPAAAETQMALGRF